MVKAAAALRPQIGFVFGGERGLYYRLSGRDNLRYFAELYGVPPREQRRRIDELLEVVNLTEVRKRPLGGFSGGMKQRVGVAQALLNDPRLLIVDEPTAGLDPEQRAHFRTLLSDLAGERIVILSTHIVSDVEATATDIAIISKGQLVHHATPETLLQALEGNVWEWVVPSTALQALKQQYVFSSEIRRADGVHVRTVADIAPAADAHPVAPNLEDVYLHAVARQTGGA